MPQPDRDAPQSWKITGGHGGNRLIFLHGKSANVERILHEVSALSEDERDELMRALVEDDDVSTEWREELQSRVQDMDAGSVRLIPHEEVSAEWSREIHRRAREIDEGQVRLMDEVEFLRKLHTI